MSADAVVVVGAGPTGLALACGLAAHGVPVRVLDAAPGPAVTSRALGLQPRGVEVLDRLGALGDLPDQSLPIQRVHVTVSGRPLATLPVGQRTRLGGPPGLLVSQATVEASLRPRLEGLGASVTWGAAVRTLDGDDDGVTLGLRDGGRLRASWVVGCDGAHSAVRKAVGIGFPGVPLVERFFLADVATPLPRPRDGVSVMLRGGDLLAAFPLPGPDLWRLMAPATSGGGDSGGADDTTDAGTIMRRLSARVAEETGQTLPDPEWTSSFRIQRRLADTYRRGRVLLAGDAAHIHSPLGGQGLNTGLGDAENLAWKLALVHAGHAGDRLIDTYEAERRPVAADVLAATSGATRVMFGDGWWARVARERVVVPLFNRRLVQRRIAETSSQLLVTYRGGPLGARRGRGLRAGDRVPDLPCVRDGEPTRLYVELRRGFVLLAPTGHPAAEPVRRRLGGHAQHVVTDSAEGMLVRPDGHLAWRGTEPAALEHWLEGALNHAGGGVTPAA